MHTSRLFLRRVLEWPRRIKQIFVVGLDAAMGVLAMWLAFTLRLEALHTPEGAQWLVYGLAPALALPIFVTRGLYRAIFRYTGIKALITTGKAVALYGALLFTTLLFVQWEDVPRSVGLLQPLIFLLLVGASRALGWLWLAGDPGKSPQRLLIYGAGRAGAQTAAGLVSTPQYQLLGFIDDDPAKLGQSIDGVQVHGPASLSKLVHKQQVTDILLAVPSATRQRRHQIIESMRQLPVRIRTLPGLSDLASGRVTMADFQELDVEDLIGREPVTPNSELIGRNLANQTVMVTGAGGSIGSELCRQIVRERPATLLLVDHSEYALYSIHQELLALKDKGLHNCTLVALLTSVGAADRLDAIFRAHRPSSVYHAAAYKHVPMVESNPGEGVLNNVFGTLNVVRLALTHGAKHLVLVSTDKAVRPTNIMGASKRIAEQILQAVSAANQMPFADSDHKESNPPWLCTTRLSIVRFGNVLGSSGSVIPLFRQQIASGGPITVTHPEVTRYFMTIYEAAQLVLQAGAMAEGGDLFLLDMGAPIRIEQLARRMVALSGLTVRDDSHPNGDIKILFTGLRPGEKLYEELLISDNPLGTQHPRILRAREEYKPWPALAKLLEQLQNSAKANDAAALKQVLRELVPGYAPFSKNSD
jgi:FlaA1/EpsC-like NDP-sugar epimerase